MGDELPLSDNENEDGLDLDFDNTDDEVWFCRAGFRIN